MKPDFIRRFKPEWFATLLTLPGGIVAGFFLAGGPDGAPFLWMRFAWLAALVSATFLAGKLMASYRGEGASLARSLAFAALHGLAVVAGASLHGTPSGEKLPFAGQPAAVYMGASAVFLYAAAAGVALRFGKSGEGEAPGKAHALPFAAAVAGLVPVLGAFLPASGDKPSAFLPLALFASALVALHALMLWRTYPRYAGVSGLVTRHLRNLVRVQAALVAATAAAGGQDAAVAMAAALGLYAVSALFNWFRKPFETP